MKRLLATLFAATLLSTNVQAQSNPGWIAGYIPTAADWEAAFSAKQDVFGAQAANSLLGNGSNSAAPPAALHVPSCSGPTNALIWINGTGFGCNAISVVKSYVVGSALTTTGTIGASNKSYCINPSTSITLTLPASPSTGDRIVLKDCNGSLTGSLTVTIQPSSGNIDGNPNFVMNTAFQSNGFWFNSSQWSVE